MSNESINAEEKQEPLSTSSSAVPDASVKVANLRAMCYTFISFALWLETQSHRVHSVFRFSLCRIFLSPAVWNAEPQVHIIAWIRASPCFTKGEVYHRAASELANTKPASKMTC